MSHGSILVGETEGDLEGIRLTEGELEGCALTLGCALVVGDMEGEVEGEFEGEVEGAWHRRLLEQTINKTKILHLRHSLDRQKQLHQDRSHWFGRAL